MTKQRDSAFHCIFIQGAADELFPPEEVQTVINGSIQLGSDIDLHLAPELTHYEACSYVPYLKEAARWLMDEIW